MYSWHLIALYVCGQLTSAIILAAQIARPTTEPETIVKMVTTYSTMSIAGLVVTMMGCAGIAFIQRTRRP